MLVTQSCPTLCDHVDYIQPTRFLCPWNSPGKNTGVGCHSLLQGILTTQESNLSLPHCRQIFLPTEPPGTSHPPPPQKNPLKNQMQNTRLCVLSHNLFLFHSWLRWSAFFFFPHKRTLLNFSLLCNLHDTTSLLTLCLFIPVHNSSFMLWTNGSHHQGIQKHSNIFLALFFLWQIL